MQHYPILEHDSSLPAIIEPSKVLKNHEAMPEHVVYCFFMDAIQALCGFLEGTEFSSQHLVHPITLCLA